MDFAENTAKTFLAEYGAYTGITGGYVIGLAACGSDIQAIGRFGQLAELFKRHATIHLYNNTAVYSKKTTGTGLYVCVIGSMVAVDIDYGARTIRAISEQDSVFPGTFIRDIIEKAKAKIFPVLPSVAQVFNSVVTTAGPMRIGTPTEHGNIADLLSHDKDVAANALMQLTNSPKPAEKHACTTECVEGPPVKKARTKATVTRKPSELRIVPAKI